MKATYHAHNGKIHFEMEGDSPKALWKKLALVQEIFDSDDKCGACGSIDIVFRSRTVDDFEFFELSCRECYARLQFGQHKKGGGLFPKRKDEDGHWLDNRGWARYEKHENGQTAQPQPQQPPARPNGSAARGTPVTPQDRISDDDIPF